MKPAILFVDDDADLLEGMRLGLSRGPYEVLTATSGEEGLRILAARDVAIVVSDDRMPGMRGADFLSVVAERHPTIVTMLLTGYGDLETAMHAINQARVSRFLLKPCPIHELKQILSDALQLRNLAVASSRLLLVTRQEQAVLHELEERNPGITHVTKTDDGAVVIDDPELEGGLPPAEPPRSVEELIHQIESVVSRLDRRKAA